MLNCKYASCCKVLPSGYTTGPLISPGLFRKETPLVVPFPIHEKLNRDKILNVPTDSGQVVDTKDKLINNTPKKPVRLPKVENKVPISTKAQKRGSGPDKELIDTRPTKVPKPTNLSRYRLDVKD